MRKHAALLACALVVFATAGIGIASADSGTGSPSGPAGRLPGSGALVIAPDDIETYISPSVILRVTLVRMSSIGNDLSARLVSNADM